MRGGCIRLDEFKLADYPRLTRSAAKGHAGVGFVSRLISDFGWIFRKVDQEFDFGIDAFVDVVKEDGSVTGQSFGLQIKNGASYFKYKKKAGYLYKGEKKHINFLRNQAMPVLIVIADDKEGKAYWWKFDPSEISLTGDSWQVIVPYRNVLRSSKDRILSLLPRERAEEPAEFLARAQLSLLLTHEQVLLNISRREIEEGQASRAIAMMRRFEESEQLAHHLMSSVHLSVDGYNDDERELLEFDEVKKFMSVIAVEVDTWLYFLMPDEYLQSAFTILGGAADAEVEAFDHERGMFPIAIDISKALGILLQWFAGLNRISDRLGIPTKEQDDMSQAILGPLFEDMMRTIAEHKDVDGAASGPIK